jgi:PAS domain S-box-containing protein
LGCVSTAAPVNEVRRVLILNELGLWSPGVNAIDQQIFAALRNSPHQIEFYVENLDTSLFADPASQQRLHEWYFSKYRERTPDLIVAVGPSPLRFMAEQRQRFAPNAPVVFWASTEELAEPPKLDGWFTGVWGLAQPEKTLEAALSLLPSTKHVFVTGGTAPYDRYLETLVKERFHKYEDRLEFTYLTDLDMPSLLERLKNLPPQSIVYHTSIMKDAVGTHFIDATQSAPMVARTANAPVFAVDDVDVGSGTVGGDVFSFDLAGKAAASMALRILNGEKPETIPIVRGANVCMFDWRALERWGLDKSNLPSGTVVLNKQLNFWETYQRYAIAAGIVLIAQTAAIVALLWQWSRKRRAQVALQKSEEKFSRMFRNAPTTVTLTSVKNHRYIDVNETFETMTGWKRSEVLGRSPIELGIWAVPQQKYDQVSRLLAGDTVRNMEFSLRTRSGDLRTILSAADLVEVNHEKCVVSIGSDITDLKRAQDAMRESEERFRFVANAAPVMIWMTGTDNLCSYVNQPWLDFTGRSLNEELGTGWTEGIHPEDIAGCLETATRTFARREPCEVEYRLRRHDGEYRWIFDRGVPRFHADGAFAGYIGSCLDVTERRMAEEALSTVSRKLIEAHEEERTWIARELHDDVNQRLALLAVNMDVLNQQLPNAAAEAKVHAADIKHQVKELGVDVQALSHRLHSSKLEHLGLSAASAAFCRELSQRKGVHIDFSSEDVPRSLPEEISLCLFRVLQEALQNAVKHSGSNQCKVSIQSQADAIVLTVSDSGCGFLAEETLKNPGIGLISMRERIKIVNGELLIDSQKGRGTVIRAKVPVRVSTRLATAAARA